MLQTVPVWQQQAWGQPPAAAALPVPSPLSRNVTVLIFAEIAQIQACFLAVTWTCLKLHYCGNAMPK